MSIKTMTLFSVMVAVLGVVSPAAARTDAEQTCVLDEYDALSVAPYHQDEDFGLGTHTRLRGAQIYVEAKPGLTAEWLTVKAQRELAQAGSCGPSVKDVRVSVTSAGGGFWMTFAGKDDRSAKALLEWARGVVPAAKR